jgi:hypothetical protein
MRRFVDVFPRLDEFGGASCVVHPSPSRAPWHYHITVTLGRKLSNLERIALQSVAGSDPMRELMSFRRACRGDSDPTLFFELEEAVAATTK